MCDFEEELRNHSSTLLAHAKEELLLMYKQSKEQKMKIYLRPRSGGIYLGQALNDVLINQEVISKIPDYSCSVKKYQDSSPKTLLDLVKYSGGFKKAISRLDCAVGETSFLSLKNYEVDYLKDIIFVLGSCLAFCQSNKSKKYTLDLPFCILCWRERSPSSKSYCNSHSKDRDLRQNDLRALKRSISQLESSIHLQDLMAFYVSKRFKSIAAITKYVGSQKKIDAMRQQDWRTLAIKLMEYIKDEYSFAYLKIEKITPADSSTWLSWLSKIRWALDPEDAEKKFLSGWLDFQDNELDWMLLLAVVQRLHAYYLVQQERSSKPGPRKGRVNKNQEIRQKIRVIAERQIKEIGRINAAAIAREVGLTRERVRVLLKDCQ